MPNIFYVAILFSLLSACNPSSNSPPTETTPPSSTLEISTPGEDPLVAQIWFFENTGQGAFSRNGGKAGEDLRINQAMALGFTGKGIKIAVSDSGVDTGHPDLIENGLPSEHRDYSSSGNWHGEDPYPKDGEGHGTAVTGLISAMGWNSVGSRGVAPNSKFAGFYFLGDFHDSTSSYEAKVLDQMNGDFDIFNYSYGYSGCRFHSVSSSVVEAYRYGVTNLRRGLGAIYVKAAGNDYKGENSNCRWSDSTSYFGNTNTNEDQNLPYLIVAGAVNAQGKASSYSTPGSGLWVASAGGEFGTDSPAMITTDIQGCSSGISTSRSPANAFNNGSNILNRFCNYTNIMNGTSSAAPTLAGVIALILEARTDLSWRDVKHILAMSAEKIQLSYSALSHPMGPSHSPSGHVYDYRYVKNAAGHDFSNTYGFGRVNAFRAIKMALDYDFPLGKYIETYDSQSGAWTYQSGTLNLSIPDNSNVGASHSMHVAHDLSIESIQIKLNTDHTYVGDLGIELTSPSGTVSKILLVNSNINHSGLVDYTLLTNAFYGEASKGLWKIKIIDGARDDIGKLKSWKIKINGGERP